MERARMRGRRRGASAAALEIERDMAAIIGPGSWSTPSEAWESPGELVSELSQVRFRCLAGTAPIFTPMASITIAPPIEAQDSFSCFGGSAAVLVMGHGAGRDVAAAK